MIPTVVIPKETQVQYPAFLAENNASGLAQFFEALLAEEQVRSERFAGSSRQLQQEPPLGP